VEDILPEMGMKRSGKPAWEITNERTIALKAMLDCYRHESSPLTQTQLDKMETILRDMLKEVLH